MDKVDITIGLRRPTDDMYVQLEDFVDEALEEKEGNQGNIYVKNRFMSPSLINLSEAIVAEWVESNGKQ